MNSLDTISGAVLDLSIKMHRELGPGLLESVYETVLAAKLAKLGYKVDRQKPVDIEFEDMRFEAAFRIDVLVNDRLLIEIKSVERLSAAHAKQLLTTKQPLGLLINFGGATLREGFRRLVNNYDPSASPRLCASSSLSFFVPSCIRVKQSARAGNGNPNRAPLVTKAQRNPRFGLWKSRVVTATPRPILAQKLPFLMCARI